MTLLEAMDVQRRAHLAAAERLGAAIQAVMIAQADYRLPTPDATANEPVANAPTGELFAQEHRDDG
jgi:hypothetical protein